MSDIKENKLTSYQESEIRQAFDKYDDDKNGTISKAELRLLLDETLHRKVSDRLFGSYLELQFNATDKDFNGVIDFDEFKSLYSKVFLNPELPISMKPKAGAKPAPLESGTNSPKLKRQESILSEDDIADARVQFKKYDKDGSGTIDREELKELLLVTMGKKMSAMMVQRMVDAQMQLADKDGSGEIDFDEFLTVYNKIIASSKAEAGASGGIGIQMPGMMGMPMMGGKPPGKFAAAPKK
eukprot:TRINITY_DN627_c0_g1_i1.p1 TRINITY_DN627_c0_g1~~TRINITY_DN627_c0_g1_i1.p1  ORF type:complete len:240 (+),score=71.02 TRINITY_DN627_c0_g1_i1:67-786(+)